MKKLLWLAVACAFLFGCSKDDDSSNNNCAKAENISIDQINSNSVFFSWDTGGNSAFEFEYGINGFALGSGQVVQTSQTEYLVEGLEPSTTYEIFLRSNCGSDGYSDYISGIFQTLVQVDICNAPSNLALVTVSDTSIGLTWDENNETAWQVEFGPIGYIPGTGTPISSTDPNYNIVGLLPSTTYEIYVRADCGTDGFSAYSEQLVVTTDGN